MDIREMDFEQIFLLFPDKTVLGRNLNRWIKSDKDIIVTGARLLAYLYHYNHTDEIEKIKSASPSLYISSKMQLSHWIELQGHENYEEFFYTSTDRLGKKVYPTIGKTQERRELQDIYKAEKVGVYLRAEAKKLIPQDITINEDFSMQTEEGWHFDPFPFGEQGQGII